MRGYVGRAFSVESSPKKSGVHDQQGTVLGAKRVLVTGAWNTEGFTEKRLAAAARYVACPAWGRVHYGDHARLVSEPGPTLPVESTICYSSRTHLLLAGLLWVASRT